MHDLESRKYDKKMTDRILALAVPWLRSTFERESNFHPSAYDTMYSKPTCVGHCSRMQQNTSTPRNAFQMAGRHEATASRWMQPYPKSLSVPKCGADH